MIAMTYSPSQESAFDPWPSSNHSLSSEEDSDLKQVNKSQYESYVHLSRITTEN